MGGRVAEVMKCGDVTTGASNDFEQATSIAREMIMRYGMSKKLAHRSFGRRQEAIFLGREISEERNYSLKTEEVIDNEIDRLLKLGEDNAKKILKENEKILDNVANFLLENETIDHDQFIDIIDDKTPKVKKVNNKTQNNQSSKEKTLDKNIGSDRKSDPEPQAMS